MNHTLAPESAHDDHHDHGPHQYKGIIGFIKRWVFTTNHKDIGTLYLLIALFSFFLAGAMALLIRVELFQPGHRLVDPNLFNQLTTMHGLVMLFGVIMPAFVGMANWQIPMMIGAPDMALPTGVFGFFPLHLAYSYPPCSMRVVVPILAGPCMHRSQHTMPRLALTS